MKHDSFNESTEMYLKTVVELADGTGELVPISALADRLGVSTVSATEMVHRLEDHDLLEHTPYKGVCLTDRGQQWATALIRAHRLWECLLVDKLGMPWEKTHEYACQLEHATETAVTEALAAYLDQPAVCPHGNPIPGVDGLVAKVADVALTAVQPGQSGTIQRIYPESPLLLDYLAGHGLKPGNRFTVSEIGPFNGPLMLDCCQQNHALGQEVAAHIFVKLEDTVPCN